MSRSSRRQRHSIRNRHACHPILRKGGVHEKSNSAKRAAAKRQIRKLLDKNNCDWRGCLLTQTLLLA